MSMTMNRYKVYKSKVRPEFWIMHWYNGTSGGKYAFPSYRQALDYACGFADGDMALIALLKAIHR